MIGVIYQDEYAVEEAFQLLKFKEDINNIIVEVNECHLRYRLKYRVKWLMPRE